MDVVDRGDFVGVLLAKYNVQDVIRPNLFSEL